jgi:hypothetical protein
MSIKDASTKKGRSMSKTCCCASKEEKFLKEGIHLCAKALIIKA